MAYLNLIKIDDAGDLSFETSRTKYKGFEIINIPAAAWGQLDISWPYTIAILSSFTLCAFAQTGDKIEFHVHPDMAIGTLTGAHTTSQSVITVSAAAVTNISVGDSIKIGTGTEEYEVIAKDVTLSTLTLGRVLDIAKADLDQVLFTWKQGENVPVEPNQELDIGQQSAGSSLLPANTTLRLRYFNSGTTTKTAHVTLVYKVPMT